jgi:RNA polymerase sigma factor for flagellar operon FliA
MGNVFMKSTPSARDIKEVWGDYKKVRTTYEALERKLADAKEADKPEAAKAFDKVRVESERYRNIIMEHYLHLVRYNAERIHQKLPDEVELDDLMSSGIFGLMDAIEAFDLDRGVKFETYCAPRIRGAILDELRSMDWVPRLVRSRAQKMGQVTKQLEVELGRQPNSGEIAAKMQISMEEFKKIEKDSSAVGVVSLSRKWFETDSNKDVREIDILEDKRGVDPIREIQRKDLKDMMTRGLSRAERLIVILYYFEEMTMKEIGATLDLSESRVSQMHSSIIARLRAQMSDRQKELQQVAAV